MKKELNTAVKAAILAGELIRKSLGKKKKLRYKGEINIVTDIDEKAEELIIKKLRKDFPAYGILSEERPEIKKGVYKWIIDPIDGTTNFAHEFPFFCVSIALEKEEEVVLGVVYDPVRKEIFRARKGQGAFLNNKKIRVSKEKEMKKSFLATGFPYSIKEKKENNIKNFVNFLMSSLAVRRAGAAALDLCYVACGRFDGFWEMGLCPWDMAAAGLIIEEAGGKISAFDGTKFNLYRKNILASNGLIHKQMVNILRANRIIGKKH